MADESWKIKQAARELRRARTVHRCKRIEELNNRAKEQTPPNTMLAVGIQSSPGRFGLRTTSRQTIVHENAGSMRRKARMALIRGSHTDSQWPCQGYLFWLGLQVLPRCIDAETLRKDHQIPVASRGCNWAPI